MAQKVLVIGLGDMGLPIALNSLKGGHEVKGFDLRKERCDMLTEEGGEGVQDLAAAAGWAEVAFVMVMHGHQVHDLILSEGGLLSTMEKGAHIIITATIKPEEFDALIEPCEKAGIGLIDSPVSGGRSGAEAGTLTLMCSGAPEHLEACAPAMDAISAQKFVVAEEPGMGMRAKASLQAIIGSVFVAVSEGMALAAKAGIDAEAFKNVVANCSIAGPAVGYCAERIVNRNFTDTGSQMTTIYKDLGISMDFGREQGVPLHISSAAFQVFQAAMSAFPGEDNWAAVKVYEQVTGVEARK